MLFNLFSSFIAAVILSNVVVAGFGLESVVESTYAPRIKKTLVLSGILSGLALIIYVVYALLNVYVLELLDLGYFSLLCLAGLVIGVNELYLFVNKRLKDRFPNDFTFGLQSVLLVAPLVIFNSSDVVSNLVGIAGGLVGYVAMSVLFGVIFTRLRVAPMLKSFKGLPIALIILGLIALVITGLGGIF